MRHASCGLISHYALQHGVGIGVVLVVAPPAGLLSRGAECTELARWRSDKPTAHAAVTLRRNGSAVVALRAPYESEAACRADAARLARVGVALLRVHAVGGAPALRALHPVVACHDQAAFAAFVDDAPIVWGA